MLDRLTPITKHLIFVNVVIFVALLLLPNAKQMDQDYFTLHKSNALGFRDVGEYRGELWYASTVEGQRVAVSPADKFLPLQVVTSFFNHSKNYEYDRGWFFHIVFNMMVLGMFGPMCEMVIGSKRFFNFYIFCGVVAGILLAFLDPSPVPVLGASSAVSGVLVAFAMSYPHRRVGLFFIPIKFTAREFVLGIAGISAALVLLRAIGIDIGGNISHFGHLAGMAAGYVFFKVEKYLPLPK